MRKQAMRLAMLWLCTLMLLLSPALAAAQALPEGAEIMVPHGYQQGDPLPLYRAAQRTQQQESLFDRVQAEWFNPSGVKVLENWSKRARFDHYVFNDEAQLSIDVNTVQYGEYDGEAYQYPVDDPEALDGPYPRASFAGAIAGLASSAYFNVLYNEDAPVLTLEKDALTGITLDQARAQVEAMLEKLGMEGYELSYALDMSVEHIHILGEYEARLREEYYNQNTGWWDFSTATEADEGYYLYYLKYRNGVQLGSPDGASFWAGAFVNADGICYFKVVDSYAVGDVYTTPDRLLTAQEVYETFQAGNPRREKDGFLSPTFTGAQLMYAPMRAPDKKDGMVIAPMWYVKYDWKDVTQPVTGWAWYSALDGELVADCYS